VIRQVITLHYITPSNLGGVVKGGANARTIYVSVHVRLCVCIMSGRASACVCACVSVSM
jgi:hypothetical protein